MRNVFPAFYPFFVKLIEMDVMSLKRIAKLKVFFLLGKC
jgi:hypothetical protein